MSECKHCQNFFPIPGDAYDHEPSKGDCVVEKKDEKGRYWLSKPVFENSEACHLYQPRLHKEPVA